MPYDPSAPVDPSQFLASNNPTFFGSPAPPSDYANNNYFQPYDPSASFDPSSFVTPSDQQDPTGSQNIINQLLAKLRSGGGTQPGQNLANLGSIADQFANQQYNNRRLQGQFTQNYDNLMLDAQKATTDTHASDLKQLAIAKYLSAGGFKPQNSQVTLNGKTSALPTNVTQPTGSSDAQIQGANSLIPQLTSQLAPGGTYTPQPLSSYATPGTAENIGQYAGLGLSGAGVIQNMLNPGGSGTNQALGGTTAGNILGGLASGAGLAKTGVNAYNALTGANTANTAAQGGAAAAGGAGGLMGTLTGKILPIAGIGLGGYQMLQNKGTLSNIMGGTEAGAGVGTMILPGVGTAIGAGIGALAGGIESLFNIGKPSAQELGGRSAHDYMNNQLAAHASPAQMAEAQKAVQSGQWKDPQSAAALIVVRDTLIKSGLSPAAAVAKSNQVMGQIANNVTSGAGAVQSAYSPIQSIMNGSQV